MKIGSANTRHHRARNHRDHLLRDQQDHPVQVVLSLENVDHLWCRLPSRQTIPFFVENGIHPSSPQCAVRTTCVGWIVVARGPLNLVRGRESWISTGRTNGQVLLHAACACARDCIIPSSWRRGSFGLIHTYSILQVGSQGTLNIEIWIQPV